MSGNSDCKVPPPVMEVPTTNEGLKKVKDESNKTLDNTQNNLIKELGLTKDQQDKLAKINTKWASGGMKGGPDAIQKEASSVLTPEQQTKLKQLTTGDKDKNIQPDPVLSAAQMWTKNGMKSCSTDQTGGSMEMKYNVLGGLLGAAGAAMKFNHTETNGCEPVTMISKSLEQSTKNISCTINQAVSSMKLNSDNDISIVMNTGNITIDASGASNLNIGDISTNIRIVAISEMSQESQTQIKNNLKSVAKTATNLLQTSNTVQGDDTKGPKYFGNTSQKMSDEKVDSLIDQTLTNFNNGISNSGRIELNAGDLNLNLSNSKNISLWSADTKMDVVAQSLVGSVLKAVVQSSVQNTQEDATKIVSKTTQKEATQASVDIGPSKTLIIVIACVVGVALIAGIIVAIVKSSKKKGS